jgi:DNA-binding response OmpR family regulator/DNA-binding CsgD family transcriptional regulator
MQESLSQSTLSQGTIMIVDDTPANLAVLSDALQEQGYRVLVATDGYSALEQLSLIKPDVILLDGMMPGMDGFETCHRIKSDRDTQNIPILFMTALGDIDNLLRGFNEGAIDYIVKPFRHEEVLARVGAQVAQRRLFARAEQTLQENSLAVLAINRSGNVTWITHHAAQLLTESNIDYTPTISSMLLAAIAQAAEDGIAKIHYCDVVFKVSACGDGNEYLLLLQKSGNPWNLDALRGDLCLTAREAEILMWVSRGKTNRDIGTILATSPRTVNKHLEHIFEKLGVGTRSAAVSVALRQLKSEI